jgi:phosphatidylinositol alpha-mannosyltransferase
VTPDVAPLRVAMVCPYDLSRPGGVQGQARGLARALRRAGHEVVVVAPDDRRAGWATGHVYVAGRSVGLHSNGSVAPVSVSPLAAKRALDAVREWGADVVHLHEPLAPSLGYGFLLSGRWPMVATFHRAGVPRGAPLVAPVSRRACARVQVRTSVSEVARVTATAMCGGDVEVLFNGVDLERFSRARPVESARPAVMFIGRHERRKGLGVLLDAFGALSAGGLDAELWVAGEGPETAELRARHPESETVHWLGVVSDDEAADRLAGASVLCAPSLGGESFGMVVLEGMAARTRVVASDIPGYREAAGGHATLVAPGDPGVLGAAIAKALGEPADADALEAAASYAGGWSTDELARRYVDAYERAGRILRGSAGGSLRA